MQTQHGLGHRISKHRRTDLPNARGLLGGRRGLSPSAALSQFASVGDQGQAGTCVAFALSQAIYVRALKLGIAIEMPSRHGVYFAALTTERRLELPGNFPDDGELPVLQDRGADPVVAAQGLQELGAVGESALPYDESKVTQEVGEGLLQGMQAFTLRGMHQATELGPAGEGLSPQEAAQSIDCGFPFAMGIQVDASFENYDGKGAPLEACDPKDQQGGHMTLLLDFGPESQMGVSREFWLTPRGDSMVFRGINSWGITWGQGGFYLARPSFVSAPTTCDGLIFDAVPGVTQKMADDHVRRQMTRVAKKVG